MIIMGLLLLACGGEDEPVSQSDETVSEAADVTDNEAAEVEDIPAEAAPPPLYPDGTIDPGTITAETPVSAVALFESYFVWDGRKVTVEGYPYIPYGADTLLIEDDIELIAEPGSRDRLATMIFADAAGTIVMADQPLTISGTIEYYWTGDIEIADCVILENAPPAQAGIVTSPYVYDGATPILIGEFFDMFNVWSGREIIVEGNYHSTTTSTTSYGVTVRVDLSDPNDTYSKLVACEMIAEIPAGTDSIMTANRTGTQIRGTVAGESFDMVGLENCELINR